MCSMKCVNPSLNVSKKQHTRKMFRVTFALVVFEKETPTLINCNMNIDFDSLSSRIFRILTKKAITNTGM